MSTFKWMGGARTGKVVKKSKESDALQAQRNFFALARQRTTPAFAAAGSSIRTSAPDLTPAFRSILPGRSTKARDADPCFLEKTETLESSNQAQCPGYEYKGLQPPIVDLPRSGSKRKLQHEDGER